MMKDEDHKTIENEQEDKQEKSVASSILSYVIFFVIVFGLTFLIIEFVGQRTRVEGSSMETTLSDGDNLIVDKISYRFTDPKRFDIIIFPYRYQDNISYIKRIIGLPGETVQIDYDGNIYIDGEILQESYGREPMYNPGIAEEPIVLGEDEYFVLGDNRNNSSDSRMPDVGKIHKDEIVGRAFVRIFPFNEITFIQP